MAPSIPSQSVDGAIESAQVSGLGRRSIARVGGIFLSLQRKLSGQGKKSGQIDRISYPVP